MPDVFDVRVIIGGPGGIPPGPLLFETSGVLSEAIDGDTIRVDLDSPMPWETPVIRFMTMDAPELDGPTPEAALEAKEFVENLALDRQVTVRAGGEDKFGRMLARVQRASVIDIGAREVELGLAGTQPDNIRAPSYDTTSDDFPLLTAGGFLREVIDGDTVRVDLQANVRYTRPRIRLVGLQCSELNGFDRGLAAEALQFVIDFALGEDVIVKAYGVEKFGRVIANVEVDGLGDLSEEIRAAGLGVIFPAVPNVNPFEGEGGKLQIDFT